MVVERVDALESADEVAYSDGFLGGWTGVQTEVVTCPHCGIVISWRKNCLSADLLRQAGDLDRFTLPPAAWGPPALYAAGFRQYDTMFHAPTAPAAPGAALPRLTQPPAPTVLWALRKRAALARGLLWLDNDRDRSEYFFGGDRPGPRITEEEQRRALLLRALIEAALFGGDESERNAVELGEWHRELGEWDDAARVLDRKFEDRVMAHRAGELRDLVSSRMATVMPFEPPPPQPVAPPPPPPAKAEAKRSAKPDPRSPRVLLGTVLEVLGTLPADSLTRDHIPRPFGSLLRTLAKAHNWDEDALAVSVVRGLARAHGWPQDADAESLRELEAFEVSDELLDYLATVFKRASWDQWALDVPATPAPKGRK